MAGCKSLSPPRHSTDLLIQQEVKLQSSFLSISVKSIIQIDAAGLAVQTSWDIQKLARTILIRFFVISHHFLHHALLRATTVDVSHIWMLFWMLKSGGCCIKMIYCVLFTTVVAEFFLLLFPVRINNLDFLLAFARAVYCSFSVTRRTWLEDAPTT